MAISKKGKRRITVNGINYLWWIIHREYDQSEFEGWQIQIISEDQIVYFKYGIEQNSTDRYVAIALNQDRFKIHILCSKFEDDSGIIRPSGIEKLIKWSLQDPEDSIAESITHAYSPQIGVIAKDKRLETYRFLLDQISVTRTLNANKDHQ